MIQKFCSTFGTLKFVGFATAVVLSLNSVRAGDITTANIVPLARHLVGSGKGRLDLRMFTFSGAEIPNTSAAFNGDNANNVLPQGGGSDSHFFGESYVTTAGDLKSYFSLNFPSNSINQIVVFLDLNETCGGSSTNMLEKFDVVLNPASIQGNPKPAGDVSSATQAGIKQIYTGGLTIGKLHPQPAANLPVINQGAGFADYAIFTGINPYSLKDTDVLLFNVSMSHLSGGAEEIFLSGNYSPPDFLPVPEPGSLSILVLGGFGLWAHRRMRQNK